MKSNTLLLILSFFLIAPVYGQKKDSVRDIYVERFPDYFFIWPVMKRRAVSFDVQQIGKNGSRITFTPNNSYGLGFGVYLFEVGAEVTFSIPVDEKKNDLFGESKALDLQLNLLGKHWGADVFYQRYTGFYISDPNRGIPANAPYPQRPDMSTDNFGINGIYTFNKDKFSLRSAYNFAERQRKSAGSLLLTGTISSFEVKADSAIYGKSYESIFGSGAAVSEFNAFTISVAPGGTYTLVIARNFFINGTFSIGPAYRNVSYTVKDEKYSSGGIDGFVDFRAAIGYNGEHFFSGISLVSQTRSVRFDEAKLTSVNTTAKFLIGYRFREFGIFKTRAVDLLPFGKKNN
ncbi:hypothetical protein BH09BAC3_BH09BAC3_34960 [soil metagenome]